MIHDLRLATRSLRRSPEYAMAAIATLALGIGANTAIFSLVHGVLLRPLPYERGDELVVLQQETPGASVGTLAFSINEFYDIRDRNATLARLVEHHSMQFTLLGRGEPQRVRTGVVSYDFFETLGIVPLHGRTFRSEDEVPGAEAVLVLSHGYWQRAFGGEPEVVGEVFEMNNRPHTVVGVLPPIPQYPAEQDVYMPTSACPFRARGEQARHDNRSAFRALTVFGRRAPGVSSAQIETDLEGISARFAEEHPDTYPASAHHTVRAEPLHSTLTGQAGPMLWMLLATATAVLLVACANVASLTIARHVRRARELAVRAALGASRAQLVRRSIVEVTLLALVGGVLGTALAYAGRDLLVAFVARFTPRAIGVELDLGVLAFALGASLVTGVLAGALPAVAYRVNLAAALREGSKGSAGRGRQRLRAGLVVAQVALSVVLVAAAGAMVRSLGRLERVQTGFDPANVLTAQLSLNWSRYTTREAALGLFEPLLAQLEAHPEVEAAAIANTLPLTRRGPGNQSFLIEGRVPDDPAAAPAVDPRFVTPSYFGALGVPLRRGRTFRATDHAEGAPVAVINERLARAHFGEQDPIGHRVSIDRGTTWSEIVGIVGDVRMDGPATETTDELYRPLAQAGFGNRLVVRTTGAPGRLVPELKAAVHALDPGQPVSSIETLEELVQGANASPRTTAWLLSLFAGLALLITGTGISGLVAYAVGQRTHEVGIRRALGAGGGHVLRLLIGQGMALVTVGIVVGVVASVIFGPALERFLFQVRANDPLFLVAVAALLLTVAAVACWLPAQRALSVSPTTALRAD